jgi:flavin-dependent dehydrogenase
MRDSEVIIVGGGPAGSSCAWRLQRHGIECLILDEAQFPRTKLCAGWITPEVVADLELDIGAYPHGFLTFDSLTIHILGLTFRLPTPQHSIRRYEFDDWLLRRSGAPVVQHTVQAIEQTGDGYVIDGRFRCRYLVGAGGTRCPVYRSLFRAANPRAKDRQIVALEQELPYAWHDGRCHLWFYDRRLPGYSWYVPKDNGYLNVGVGTLAAALKRGADDIKRHWAHLERHRLGRSGLVAGAVLQPRGYSYYLRDDVDIGRLGNAFVVGDAAGLATRDMGEGIGPAVRSGMLAADTIAGRSPYTLASVARRSLPAMLKGALFARRIPRGKDSLTLPTA